MRRRDRHLLLHVPAVGQPVPAVGVAEGIGGEPLAEARAVVAHQERMAEAVDVRLAGEEGLRAGRVGSW